MRATGHLRDSARRRNGTGPRCIVVGVDGSPSATGAARWAAREAALRGLPVRLVAVVRRPSHDPLRTGQLRVDGRAAQRLAAAAAEVAAAAPGVQVLRLLARGSVVGVLDLLARDAELVVVGSRGRGPVTGALMGSVGVAVAESAGRPVVIVHDTLGSEPARDDSDPVVVGIAEAADEGVLRFAFDEAQRRGAPLHLVHAAAPGQDRLPAAVHRLLGDVGGRHPAVAVVTRVVHERPAAALIRLSATAQLVVTGAREAKGVTARRAAVHRALMRHGRCPTVVVAARPARRSRWRSRGRGAPASGSAACRCAHRLVRRRSA